MEWKDVLLIIVPPLAALVGAWLGARGASQVERLRIESAAAQQDLERKLSAMRELVVAATIWTRHLQVTPPRQMADRFLAHVERADELVRDLLRTRVALMLVAPTEVLDWLKKEFSPAVDRYGSKMGKVSRDEPGADAVDALAQFNRVLDNGVDLFREAMSREGVSDA